MNGRDLFRMSLFACMCVSISCANPLSDTSGSPAMALAPQIAVPVKALSEEAPVVSIQVLVPDVGPASVRIPDRDKDIVLVASGNSDADLAKLARQTKERTPAGARLVLSIDGSVTHRYVLSLIDAFKKEGFLKIALSVEPKK